MQTNVTKEEPVLIGFNETEYLYSKQNIGRACSVVQSVVNQYNSLKLKPIENGELSNLFLNPVDFVFDRMTNGQPVSIVGLEVHAHKAMEILKKPIGYDDLLVMISEAKGNTQQILGVSVHQFDETFVIDGEGNILVSPEKEEKIKALYRRFATSKTAKNAYTLASTILEQVDDLGLSDIANTHKEGFGGFLKELFDMQGGKKVIINTRSILEYNSK